MSTCGLVAFTTLTLSLQLVSPNMVSSLRCLEMVVAFLVQSVITGRAPNILSSIGGGLITLGIFILGAEERIAAGIEEVVSRIKSVCRSQSEDQIQEREKLLDPPIQIQNIVTQQGFEIDATVINMIQHAEIYHLILCIHSFTP